jgi:hypothetical protein
VIKALHKKGATLAQLARSNLTFDSGQAFVVYDGNELRACPNAAAAIATVVRAKRPCSAVDLSAIRTARGGMKSAGRLEPGGEKGTLVTARPSGRAAFSTSSTDYDTSMLGTDVI